MLTGTLVTVAGFLPDRLQRQRGRRVHLQPVRRHRRRPAGLWVVAVLFAPLIGVKLLPKTMKHHDAAKPGRFASLFRAVLVVAMRWRWATIAVRVALLFLSVYGMRFVQQQFFPSSDRPEILVDMTLPQMSSIAETRKQMDAMEQRLKGEATSSSGRSYVGQGAIRFYLPLDQQLGNAFFGQIVVETKSLEARNALMPKLAAYGARALRRDGRVRPHARPRAAGRPADPVPRQRAGPAGGPRPGHQARRHDRRQRAHRRADLRLERAGPSAARRDPAGQGAPARHHQPGHRRDPQRRRRRHGDHPGARQHLPRRRDRPGAGGGTLHHRHAAEPPGVARQRRLGAAAGFRHHRLRPGAADRLAPRPAADGDAALAPSSTRCSPPRWCSSSKPAVDAFARALPVGYSVATGGAVEEAAKGQGPIAAVVP